MFEKCLVVALFAVSVVSGLRVKPNITCNSETSCFTDVNGGTNYDCDMIISFSDNITSIYVADVDYTQYFVIYTEKNGVVQDRIFMCFGGVEKCFWATEIKYEYTIKNALKSKLKVLSDKYGQFMYNFDQLPLETGPKVKYSYRKGSPGVRVYAPKIYDLFHRKGTQLPEVGEVYENTENVKNLKQLHETYESLEVEEVENLEHMFFTD